MYPNPPKTAHVARQNIDFPKDFQGFHKNVTFHMENGARRAPEMLIFLRVFNEFHNNTGKLNASRTETLVFLRFSNDFHINLVTIMEPCRNVAFPKGFH